jgi:hypothetical protein
MSSSLENFVREVSLAVSPWRFVSVFSLSLSCCGFPASPLEIGQLDLGAAYDVYVTGTAAFVSNNDGIAVVDISNVNEPRLLTTIDETSGGGTVAGLSVSGDTLLGFGDRYTVYDVAEPMHPQILAAYTPRAFVSGARMQGEYTYLAYLHGGLEMVDFSDPANPRSTGYASSSGQVNDLVIVGEIAYVANSSVGLEVYDVSDPSSIQRIHVVPGTSGAWDISIDGHLLSLGCHMHGVKILDISDPGAPQIIGSFDNGGETYGVYILGDRIFTVDLVQGVEILGIGSPTDPMLIASDDHYHPHDLCSDGRYLYLADQDRHFVILSIDLMEAF